MIFLKIIKKRVLFFFAAMVINGLFYSLMAKPALNDTVLFDNTRLILNGAGYRTAYGLRMYTSGLYLECKNNTAQTIIDDTLPMAILMVINSSLITADRLEKSTREGFANATDGNTGSVSKEIDSFLKLVKTDLKKGDNYLFVYEPGKGTSIIKNSKVIGVIGGLPFKKALFGIWLCSKPPQQELKRAMLGM